MSNDFYSFERVLRELQMEEEELKRLVSEGEIRAFRDDDKMKFRREDIDRFRRLDADTETLGDEDIPEELVFDEDDADQEVGMATAAITDDAFLEEDDGGLELEGAAASKPGRRSASQMSPARKQRILVDEPEESEGPVWATMIVLVAVATLFTAVIVGDAVKAQPSSISEGIADWVDENFLDGNPKGLDSGADGTEPITPPPSGE